MDETRKEKLNSGIFLFRPLFSKLLVELFVVEGWETWKPFRDEYLTTLLSILTHKILARERMTNCHISLRTSLAHLLTIRTSRCRVKGFFFFFNGVGCLFFPGHLSFIRFLTLFEFFFFFLLQTIGFSREILIKEKPLKTEFLPSISRKRLLQQNFESWISKSWKVSSEFLLEVCTEKKRADNRKALTLTGLEERIDDYTVVLCYGKWMVSVLITRRVLYLKLYIFLAILSCKGTIVLHQFSFGL